MKKLDLNTRINRTFSLNEELDTFMSYIGLDTKLQELKIIEVWQECVGDAIAAHSSPVELKRGKLLVTVEKAVWRSELALRKAEIINNLNYNFKKKLIKEIVFI